MRNLSMIAFVFLGFVLSGCYESHGLTPIIPMGDAGPGPVGDSGWVMPEPDSGPVVLADAGSDAGPPPELDAGPPLPPGEPVVEFFAPASLDLAVGDQRVRFRIRSTGAPIGVKRVHIGLPVHPYNEDAPDREGWNWERRFQIGWDAITIERDGIVMDDVITYRWGSTSNPFTNAIILVFLDEEIADMDGHEYVMHVPVTGDLEPGDRIGFDINTSRGDDVPARGSLTPDGTTFGPYGWRAPNIFTGVGACEGLHAYSTDVSPGLFVWSDRTAADHNDADCLTGGSTDWNDGTDMQMGGGYDLTVPAPPPGPCDAVDVPADGSGRVIVRVEGGGDMTVAPDTDFVAFSVTIENHMLTSVSAETYTHGWTLSADCTVAGPSAALTNECDATNGFHPTAGSCGGGACGYSCGEVGPVFASGTSTRFTAYAHTRASGTFGLELGFATMATWITFRDSLGSILATDVVDGDESSLRPTAIITVP